MGFNTARITDKQIERDGEGTVTAIVYVGIITDTRWPETDDEGEPLTCYRGAVRVEGEALAEALALPEPDRSEYLKAHLAAVAKERHAAWAAEEERQRAAQVQAAAAAELEQFPILTAADLPPDPEPAEEPSSDAPTQ